MTVRARMRQLIAVTSFSGLIVVGAYIVVPLPVGPVPVVLTNLFVLLAGMVMGPVYGLAAVGVYLGLGSIGLPVFAGGSGGMSVFAGPTGGFLLGFLPSTFVAGLVSAGRRFLPGKNLPVTASITLDAIAGVAGTTVLYLVGVPWLALVTGMEWPRAVMVGLLPFIPGDVAKIVLAAMVTRVAYPLFARYHAEFEPHAHQAS